MECIGLGWYLDRRKECFRRRTGSSIEEMFFTFIVQESCSAEEESLNNLQIGIYTVWYTLYLKKNVTEFK